MRPRFIVLLALALGLAACAGEHEPDLLEDVVWVEVAIVASCATQSTEGEIFGAPLVRFRPSEN